jgi:hypothetical protein
MTKMLVLLSLRLVSLVSHSIPPEPRVQTATVLLTVTRTPIEMDVSEEVV